MGLSRICPHFGPCGPRCRLFKSPFKKAQAQMEITRVISAVKDFGDSFPNASLATSDTEESCICGRRKKDMDYRAGSEYEQGALQYDCWTDNPSEVRHGVPPIRNRQAAWKFRQEKCGKLSNHTHARRNLHDVLRPVTGKRQKQGLRGACTGPHQLCRKYGCQTKSLQEVCTVQG